MDLEIWGYIFGGATIFGAIVTIGAFVNGRLTRKEVIKVIKEVHEETREEMRKYMSEVVEPLKDSLNQIKDLLNQIKDSLNQINKSLVKMEERAEKRHTEIISQIGNNKQ